MGTLHECSTILYEMQNLKPRCDARSWLILNLMFILDVTFLLTVLELVSKVGCGMEANRRQVDACLTIPPPVFQPPDAFDATEIVALTIARSPC